VRAARILRTSRQRAGISQRALAEASGIPQPSIARIEAGSSIPRVDTLERLLQATGHDLELERRLGTGVDVNLIRELLALTPDQRGRAAIQAAQGLARLRAQARISDRSQSR
jgi:transcriptional regulator with XRE-family HTH domain